MRIVSLVPSLTETVMALGLPTDDLVGCTSFCLYPEDVVATTKKVGGTKTPSLRRILALAPDLVLVDPDENRREDADALRDAGIALWSCCPSGPEEVVPLLRSLGEAIGRPREGAAAADALEGTLERPRVPIGARLAVLCWLDPPIAVAPDRYGAGLLAVLGCDVPRAGDGPYPHVTLRRLAELAPDAVLLPSEPHPFTEDDALALLEAIATAGGSHPRAVFVDGEDLFWYGARTAAALDRLETALRFGVLG